MDALIPWCIALAALNGATLCALLALLYEVHQLRQGKASMTYWERVEAIRRNTTPPDTRKSFF